MEYRAEINLSADEKYILEAQVLPTAKRWVMGNPPGTPFFDHGLKTLRYWNVQCPDLRRRLLALKERAQ